MDVPGDSSTTASISVGGNVQGELELAGDHDWFAITLTAGQPVTVTLNGITLTDPYLYIRDSSGNVLYSNDDVVTGINLNSHVAFNPGYSGTYYIDVGAFGDSLSGTYELVVQPYTPPPVATIDDIANQLTTGFWGGDRHHFDVTQGGTITVDMSMLTPAEQTLARTALQEWSDIIGVHFQEVSSGGQIVFDHTDVGSEPIAETDAQWANGIITSAHVHISSSWVNTYGTGLDTYSFQAYVHEIGHALGLGHAGDYNGDARYPYDALFKNDGWPVSVMSYFSQSDNSYYGYPQQFVLTPMGADIVAMQNLYGLSTTTRTGDTVYGFNSNAGGVFDAAQYPNAAYTIFDNGGADTLDFSGSPFDQRINLNAETFSDVNGHNLALYIARGVTIENAIGGSANDTITQNGANNVLDGGLGEDTLSYATATAGVHVDLRLLTPQDTRGAGIDKISNFEHLIGSAFADVLIASSTTLSLTGGAGDDLFDPGARTGAIGMYGDDGNDVFLLGAGEVWINGGAGFDTVDCSAASAGVLLTTNGHAGASPVTLNSIEKIIGSNFDDTLYGMAAGDTLLGGAGNDTLQSGFGNCNLAGGVGNDTYIVSFSDQITENADEGIDTVRVGGDYVLGANLENLTLNELHPADPYAGAAVPQPNQPEDWKAVGNDLANVITGNAGANVLAGRGGTDTLIGGDGKDAFVDTIAGLNGDTITDLVAGEKIIFTDADLATFTFSLSGNTLTYSGGSLTLSNSPVGTIVASAAAGGGVQLMLVQRDATNDFNGDGRSDILWRHDSGQITDWLGAPNGAFIANWSNLQASMGADWHVLGTGDFNGDGRDDILWRNDAGLTIDWIAQPSGGFTSNGANFTVNVSTNWTVAGTGDFNGDGKDDLLWRDPASGLTVDWLGQANGGFTSNWNNSVVQIPTNWKVVGIGDFNGDGKDDILWRDANSGLLVDWLGQPNGGFSGNYASSAVNVPLDWHVVGTGDFNGDGRSDIVWRHESGLLTEWLANPNGSFSSNWANVAVDVPNEWQIVQIGDFDGDGRDDLVWRSGSGQLTSWLANPSGSFTSNWTNVHDQVPANWHVQAQVDTFV